MDNLLFLAKKLLGNLLMPVPVMLLLLLWALLLLLRRKTRWFGILIVLLVTVLLFAGSYAPLSNPLISQLENQYPSYPPQEHAEIDAIAVLGSWHQSTTTQPLTSEISPTGVVRLVEGLRIYRLNPGSKLIFTGYPGLNRDPLPYPEKLAELALALGVPAEDIETHSGPRDTREEARLIAATYPAAKLVLVTSASHMPRAMALFRGAGLDPVPAPTAHSSKPFAGWWTFPRGSNLADSENWVHEQLGLLWARLLGQTADTTNPLATGSEQPLTESQ